MRVSTETERREKSQEVIMTQQRWRVELGGRDGVTRLGELKQQLKVPYPLS